MTRLYPFTLPKDESALGSDSFDKIELVHDGDAYLWQDLENLAH